MSHTIAAYEGPRLGYALGVAYEALVIGLAWEGRRRADRDLETGRQPSGHGRWLGGAIVVGVLSGALAAWHGWLLGEGIFAASRAVAPVLAAVAVHLFFQSASSARNLDRLAKIEADRETAVLDMLDAVRLAQIAPDHERAERISDVNAAVTRVHRHVPAAVTAEVTRPHLESERTIRDVVQEAATLAGEWMPEPVAPEQIATDAAPEAATSTGVAPSGVALSDVALSEVAPADADLPDVAPSATAPTDDIELLDTELPDLVRTDGAERVHLEDKYAPVKAVADLSARHVNPPVSATVTDWDAHSDDVTTPSVPDPTLPLTTQQISEIRVLRWEQNLTLHEVATRLGVSVSAVNRYAPSTDVPTTETGSMVVVPAARS
ncbi:helix-turn-helix domain-containing protein [Promicromonospora soli]|nr:helix-turn-helix transcriptional regulator [Promicromonospora soli]